MNPSRRIWMQGLGAGAALSMLGLPACTAYRKENARYHVLVVGGGPGGATCARYLKRYDPGIRVTLVEPSRVFHTCFGSNWVLGGLQTLDAIGHRYDGLQAMGVKLVRDRMISLDANTRTIGLEGGKRIHYDRLVISPGIDFNYDLMEGIGEQDAMAIPHAWKAGKQTQSLLAQLQAMPDGGVFILIPPGNPFRCPPGPYERASMVAHYCKHHKPRSKVLILDPKESFSKQALFQQGWKTLYGDMIEWVPASQGGMVERIDVRERTAYSSGGLEHFQGDVINFIPAQRAADIAHTVGLVDDSGWCPVDQLHFLSQRIPHIHVIGDACIAGKMPKSGHSANSQGKFVAASILLELAGKPMEIPSHVNTCYSLIGPEYGISVAAVYRLQEGEMVTVEGAGGVSPLEANAHFRELEAQYARSWYANITGDIFG